MSCNFYTYLLKVGTTENKSGVALAASSMCQSRDLMTYVLLTSFCFGGVSEECRETGEKRIENMEVCARFFGILEGLFQGRKDSRRREEKRWWSFRDGGGGIFFVLREGEVSSDERQVEEILIIVVCIQTEYKTRDGSE